MNVEILGEEQYLKFAKERFVESAKPFTEPLHKNQLPPFSCPSAKPKSKHKGQIKALKNDWTFFHVCIYLTKRETKISINFSHMRIKLPLRHYV